MAHSASSIVFTVEVDSKVLREGITDLLVDYTDWLIENWDFRPYDWKDAVTLTKQGLVEEFFDLEID